MISDQVTKGPDRAPHRSLFYAAGFTDEELKKPLIGVVSAQSDIIPGHTHLNQLAEAVKAGVYAAGAPRWWCRPSACATASSWATGACTTPWPPGS